MADIVRCSPTETKPTCHVSLTDGVTTIPLIAVRPDGTPDIHAIRRDPNPRNTLQVNQGDGQFSQRKPPYGEFGRNTWIGGLGKDRGESDSTAYWFGNGIWTLVDGKLTLAPKLFQSRMPWQIDNPMVPLEYGHYLDQGTYPYLAFTISPTVSTPVYGVHIKGRFTGEYVSIGIYTNNSGKPGTVVNGAYGTTCNIHLADDVFVHFSGATLTGGTVYYLRIFAEGSIACIDPAFYNTYSGTPIKSIDGTTWVTKTIPGGGAPYFVLLTERMTADIPFEYRNAFYKVTNEGGGAPHIYINGDAGACDSNAGALGTLIDGTKSWTANIWAGAIAVIIEGPGKHEWRRIGGNTATTLFLNDRPFDTAQTTASSYVIKYTPVWTEITGHGLTAPVTDLVISNEAVLYMAMGNDVNIRKFRAFNDAGTWKGFNHADCKDDDGTNKASLFCLEYDQVAKTMAVWRAICGTYTPYISKAPAIVWNAATALTFGPEIYIGGAVADIRSITPVKGSIIVVMTNGRVWEVKDSIPDLLSVDMSAWSDEYTGKGAVVHSPYLVFPYSNSIERLLGQELNDFGPKLPKAYMNPIASILSVESAIIAGRSSKTHKNGDLLDWTTSEWSPSYGSVQIYHGGTWHPCAVTGDGDSILALHYQKNENGKNLLWIFTINGTYFMRMPRSWDPLSDPEGSGAITDLGVPIVDFLTMYEDSGWIASGVFNIGNQRLDKHWENLYLAYKQRMTVDDVDAYRIECSFYDETIQIPPYDSVSDYAEIALATKGDGVSGIVRKPGSEIAFLFVINRTKMVLDDPGKYILNTPIVRGYNVEYLARIDDADMWVVPVASEDYQTDLCGVKSSMSMQTYQAKLDEWSRSIVPITMHSLNPLDDNKRVLIGRNPMQPKKIELDAVVAQSEKRYAYETSVTIYEVPD